MRSALFAATLSLSLVATYGTARAEGDDNAPSTGANPDVATDPTAATADPEGDTKTAPPNNGDLPTPHSDADPAPEVATPGMPAGGIVQQAGIGGNVGFGRAGVLELGGSIGGSFASDRTEVNATPSLGWFLADNLELSALLGLTYASANDSDATLVSGIIEPSYHLPFNRSTFAFLGIGIGASYLTDVGTGFTLAPRLGANFMIGRSGVLTPSLSYNYITYDTSETETGATLLAVASAVRFNIGYTVMW
jgi:hypothetical protein